MTAKSISLTHILRYYVVRSLKVEILENPSKVNQVAISSACSFNPKYAQRFLSLQT